MTQPEVWAGGSAPAGASPNEVNAMPIHARKFVFHDRVPPTPPENARTRALELAFGDKPLTRQEKDEVGTCLEGVYREAGWAWYLAEAKQLHRILVKFRDYPFEAWYAADKTALRQALGRMGYSDYSIVEMIDAPLRRHR
jgi:hypothetical protein